MITVYGIKNCDKVKKFLTELKASSIDFDFYDFKKNAPEPFHLERWTKFGGELPVNKRGTTYRKFKNEYESQSSDEDKISFLVLNSSMIKRPVIEINGTVVEIGYDSQSVERIKQKINN